MLRIYSICISISQHTKEVIDGKANMLRHYLMIYMLCKM